MIEVTTLTLIWKKIGINLTNPHTITTRTMLLVKGGVFSGSQKEGKGAQNNKRDLRGEETKKGKGGECDRYWYL